jgi:dynein light intermediate chain
MKAWSWVDHIFSQGEEKKHGEEINFLKRTNQQLKSQLEGIISQKK